MELFIDLKMSARRRLDPQFLPAAAETSYPLSLYAAASRPTISFQYGSSNTVYTPPPGFAHLPDGAAYAGQTLYEEGCHTQVY